MKRGKHGLFQRRARPSIFGEPLFECELAYEEGPHRIAHVAWQRMVDAARTAGVDQDVLGIHSAYRSVAWQRHIFDYWVEERRKDRANRSLPEVSTKELRRMQLKWTAGPGKSAHHTGLAIDLKLYELGKKDCKRHPAYTWLAQNARLFGFYPYFPEGWHWEYNPPGLVEQLRQLREGLGAGEVPGNLLEAPAQIPMAESAVAARAAIS